MAGAGIRADNVWDEYMEDTKAEVFIAASTVPVTKLILRRLSWRR